MRRLQIGWLCVALTTAALAAPPPVPEDLADVESALAAQALQPAERAQRYLAEAETRKPQNREQAIALARKGLAQAQVAGDAGLTLQARLLLVDLYLAARQADAADAELAQAEREATSPALSARRAAVLYLRARWQRDRQQDAAAAASFDAAARLAAELGDELTESRAQHSYAILLLREGQQDQARIRLERSLALNEAAGREREADANRHYLGLIARDASQYTHALELHETVLGHSEARGDRQGVANSANAIAILQAHKQQCELAVRYFDRALTAFRELGDQYGIAMALANRGFCYGQLGQRAAADADLDESLRLAQAIGNVEVETLARNQRGEIAVRFDDLARAEGEVRRAAELARAGGDDAGVYTALTVLAEVRRKQQRHAEAVPLLREATTLARKLKRSFDDRESTAALARAQAAVGDYRAAYASQLEVQRLTDALQDDEMTRRLAEQRAQHEAETREHELASQRTRIELLEQQAAQQQRIRYLMVAALLSAALLVLALISRARNKQRAEAALRAHNALIERSNRDLADAADTDALTGARNRRHFQRVLLPQLEAADSGYALVLIDADHFKQINDLHGHDVGDQALVAIAQAWRECIGTGATLVRWGGEEFLAVLPDCDEASALAHVDCGLQAVRALALDSAGTPLRLSVSAGWVLGPQPDCSVEALLRLADTALLRAKREGRDRALRATPEA